jgi:hypothetical protein
VAEPPVDDHSARVHESFDALHRRLGPRLDEAGKSAMEKLRSAAASRDARAVREGLTELQSEHGWLYNELAAHPQLANLLDELALFGL